MEILRFFGLNFVIISVIVIIVFLYLVFLINKRRRQKFLHQDTKK